MYTHTQLQMHTPSHAGSSLTHKGTRRDPEAHTALPALLVSRGLPPNPSDTRSLGVSWVGGSPRRALFMLGTLLETQLPEMVVSGYPPIPNPHPVLGPLPGTWWVLWESCSKGTGGRDLSGVQPSGAYIARLPVLGSHSPCSDRLPYDSGPHSRWLQRLFSEMLGAR